MVIDELKFSMTYSGSPVAFFYFDYRDPDRQTPMGFLSRILGQIVATIPEIPKSVSDIYDKARGSTGSLPLHELEKLMLDITSKIGKTYLIVDALDECSELTHRKPVLQLLYRLEQMSNIRLFVTSRHYPHDIKAAFHNHPQIEIHAHESDLRRYMYQQLNSTDVADIIDHGFGSKVVETLINRAQGM